MSKHVKVKPLEWEAADEDEEDYVFAFSEIGAYSIERLSAGSWELTAERPSGGECSWYVTIEAAKAAAQADYESRILSALEPSPAFEAMVEALEGLVKCCEEHDAAIASVMGKPPGWKDAYLDTARAALASVKGEQA